MRLPMAMTGILLATGLSYAQAPCPDQAEIRHPRQEGFYAPVLGDDPTQAFTRLGKTDLRTGQMAEAIADFGADYKLPFVIPAGAFDRDGTYYSILTRIKLTDDAPPPTSQLAMIDIDNRAVIPIGTPNSFNLGGFGIDACGQIYATGTAAPPVTVGDNSLYTVDKETGVATPVGSTGIDNIMDLAFDASGTLYATVANMLYTLDPATGQVLSEIPLNGVPQQRVTGPGCGDDPECDMLSEVMSIAFDKDDVLYAKSLVAGHRPLLEVDGAPHGAPLMRIDLSSGEVGVVAWTGEPSFHGGDIPSNQVINATSIEALGWGVIKASIEK